MFRQDLGVYQGCMAHEMLEHVQRQCHCGTYRREEMRLDIIKHGLKTSCPECSLFPSFEAKASGALRF